MRDNERERERERVCVRDRIKETKRLKNKTTRQEKKQCKQVRENNR